MTTAMRSADLAAMDTQRGQAIQRRLDDLGISDREFHEQTGIDRKTLRRAVAGQENVRPSTYAAIEVAIDKLEKKMRPPVDISPNHEGLVTFRISGNFGVDVVVQGPVANLHELETSVERLLRGMRPQSEPRAEEDEK